MSKPSQSRTILDNLKQVLTVLIFFFIMKTSIVEAYKIPSQSMEDTLLVGDFLLANKFVYGARLPMIDWRLPGISDPERGDIIIFVFPGDGETKYIKRCIGLPGDTIEIKDKAVFINGEEYRLPEHGKYIARNPRTGELIVEPRRPGGYDSRDNFGPLVVPPESYFMMGDNRDNSYDSRYWGTVPAENILGEAMVVHWSWDDSELPSPEVSIKDPLSVPRMYIYNVVHFFEKVRWGRLFSIVS